MNQRFLFVLLFLSTTPVVTAQDVPTRPDTTFGKHQPPRTKLASGQIVYSGSVTSLRNFSGDPNISIIGHHGDNVKINGFESVYSHTEIIRAFANQSRRAVVAQMSQSVVADLLSGSIENWSQVGGRPGIVAVYTNGDQQKDKITTEILRDKGFLLTPLARTKQGYGELKVAGETDVDSIVVGLRDEKIALSGRFTTSLAMADNFEITVPVYFYYRTGHSTAAADLRSQFDLSIQKTYTDIPAESAPSLRRQLEQGKQAVK